MDLTGCLSNTGNKTSITAFLAMSSLTLSSLIFTAEANAAIIINEVDYDQPGKDRAEFIELFNNGSHRVSLEGYSIKLINGAKNTTYRTINLDTFNMNAGGYFVICGDSTRVENCNFDFTNKTGWIQNGAPDALALYDQRHIVDSLSYEGSLSPYTEGAPVIAKDSNKLITDLSRLPNGIDSNVNRTDFNLGCITPGTANIAGTGNCSTVSVSAVPVPAAIWLLSSGLAGFIGIGYKKKINKTVTS